MQARLAVGGLLAMIGGLLMIWSGYVSHSIIYQAIGEEVPVYLSGFAGSAASFAVSILELINALGGIVVFIGGMILVSGHARTGSIVIILGGGAGFVGLLAAFGYSSYKLGLNQTISYAPYWVGLVFTVAARRLSRGSKGKVKAAVSAS